jgi:hypothetical protein
MSRRNIHTIYDVLENKGAFSGNPANAGAVDKDGKQLYLGPMDFPKMFYHPKAELVEINPGELVATLEGPRRVNRQTAMAHQVAYTKEDEKRLRAEGWHDHPAKALRATGQNAPATGAAEHIAELERKIRELEEERERTEEAA